MTVTYSQPPDGRDMVALGYVQQECPSCAGVGRVPAAFHGALAGVTVTCGRCSGYGHVYSKGKP